MMLLAPFAGFCQAGGGTGDQAGFPVIGFEPRSRTFTAASKSSLPQIADQIKQNPGKRIVIAGNAGGNKYDQQLSWEHIDAVIQYLSESQNIDRNTFIVQLQGPSRTDEVTLRAAAPGEDGPSTVIPPNPGIIIK